MRNPETGDYFTDSAAWAFIADKLVGGHSFREVELQQPAGKKGYVMLVDVGADCPQLYIKLQILSGCVVGRSFHYSYSERDNE